MTREKHPHLNKGMDEEAEFSLGQNLKKMHSFRQKRLTFASKPVVFTKELSALPGIFFSLHRC
jgi:hypothetical protein